jgi:hypothetical protein
MQFTSPSGNLDNVSITTSVLIEAMTGNDNEIGIEFFDGFPAVDCELDKDPRHSNGVLWLVDDDNLDQSMPLPWAPGTEYRLTMTRTGTSYTCSAVSKDGKTTVTVTGTSAIVVPTAVDLWAYGVTAQLGSVQVIGAP